MRKCVWHGNHENRAQQAARALRKTAQRARCCYLFWRQTTAQKNMGGVCGVVCALDALVCRCRFAQSHRYRLCGWMCVLFHFHTQSYAIVQHSLTHSNTTAYLTLWLNVNTPVEGIRRSPWMARQFSIHFSLLCRMGRATHTKCPAIP